MNLHPRLLFFFLIFGTLLFAGCNLTPNDALAARVNAKVVYRDDLPGLGFAAGELRAALESRAQDRSSLHSPSASPELAVYIAESRERSRVLADNNHCDLLPPDFPAESYAIRKVAGSVPTYLVLANDAVGAMYGMLDLAEAARLGTLDAVGNSDHRPFIPHRGIKFNLPLDARTPSYSDAGDAAQQNIPEMWSMDFWHEFIDEMARDRMDTLTLWNLHPFPSMVKVPEYPDIALADVKRTTVKFDSTYSTQGKDMVRPATLANLETLKKMTIEEKIAFWRAVMDYAHDRGIDIYLFTWNIYDFGADGKYGITNSQANPATIDYYRKSVREAFLTYPRLAGIGITAGENMTEVRGGENAKEDWLWKTYGQGIEDAKKIQPDRTMRLIHRMHQTLVPALTDVWKDFTEPMDLEYKYSIAHMYSSPAPPFYKKDLVGVTAKNPVWFTARNDDIYNFRWGDPDFARDYVRHIPGPEIRAGLLIGSDGMIWGREIVSTDPDSPRQLFIKKHWLSTMMWGRLAYEPELPNALFQRTLDVHFPQTQAGTLYQAFAAASKIVPRVNRFFWPPEGIDLTWFPEACTSHPSQHGFYSVKDFMNGSVMAESGIMNIRDYTAAVTGGKAMTGMTPVQVAEMLQNDAGETLAETLRLPHEPPAAANDKELRQTLGDLEAMAYLGDYYADKILGATELALFNATGQAEHQQAAVRFLQAGVEDWKHYAAVATRQYKPQLLTRIGYVDLNALTAKVEQDVEIARTWRIAP